MDIDWNSVAVGAGMTVLAHPFTYVKVLIQLGHEPLAPVVNRNMFFRKQLQYPNIFKYMKHIKETDGVMGLYRGVGPRICANLSTSLTYSAIGQLIEPQMSREPPSSKDDVKTLLNKVCDHTTKEMIARCSAVVISQPFHVIAIRTMAQFIGQETIYSNMYMSTVEIYNQDGIMGFFAGLFPRLAAEIITLWLSNVLAYALNTYVLTESSDLKDLRQYSQMAMSYLAQTATYPLSVTSTVMAVNGARIRGGRPPFMVIYGGWYSCLKDLHQKGQSSRGSSMWFRKALAHTMAATAVSPMPPPPVV